MKILTVGDLHNNEKWKERIVEEANSGKYNVFLGLGDFEDAGYYKSLQEQIEITNISCTGNWDFHFRPPANNDYPMLYNYAKVNLDEYKVIMLGSIYPGTGDLVKELKEFIGDHPKEKLIFCSHYPPYQMKDFASHTVSQPVGQPEFKELIMRFKPLLWLCGHIHEDTGPMKFMNTIIINAAAHDTSEAYALELDDKGVKKITAINLDTRRERDVEIPEK